MLVYNESKTKILEEYDLELGYLKEDTISIEHPKIEEVIEQGHYEIVTEYENGGIDVKWVIDIPGIKGKEAYTEILDIQVYIQYTKDELEQLNLNKLKGQRKPLLEAFDKYRSAVSYGIVTETEKEHEDILIWYYELLNIETVSLDINKLPEKIKYYLEGEQRDY